MWTTAAVTVIVHTCDSTTGCKSVLMTLQMIWDLYSVQQTGQNAADITWFACVHGMTRVDGL